MFFLWVLLLMIILFCLESVLGTISISGCVENSTTHIIECTGGLSGTTIDVDNASVWISQEHKKRSNLSIKRFFAKYC
jgi:hypothetical protein